MNELKTEDVMRALECCAEEHCGEWCPFYDETPCEAYLAKAALALLREKDAEIEHLKMREKVLTQMLDDGYNEWEDYVRAEAITEFAERLIAKKCHYTETEHTFDFDGVTVEDIDQIAKEMKG